MAKTKKKGGKKAGGKGKAGGGKSAFQSRLGKLKGKWNKAKERAKEEGFGATLDDGRYVAQLVKAEVDESRSSNRLQAHYQYQVTEGESEGETIHKWDGLETEENLVWFAREMARYGYDIDDLDLGDIEELLKELSGRKPVVRLRLRTRGEFQNVYLDKVLEDESGDEEPDDDEEEGDEEEGDDDEEEGDDLDDLSRAQLKKLIKDEKLEVKVKKSMDDDAVREAIREARPEDGDEDEEEDDEDEVEIDVGDVVEFDHGGKRRSSKIVKIDEEGGKVQVMVGKKKVWKKAEEIEAASDETDD